MILVLILFKSVGYIFNYVPQLRFFARIFGSLIDFLCKYMKIWSKALLLFILFI